MKECHYIPKKIIEEVLAQSSQKGKRHLEPLKSLFLAKKIPFGIMEDMEVESTESEVHTDEGDLWYCLEGEAEFVYGGELENPFERPNTHGKELGGSSIKGGTTVTLKPGDWLWIPAGQPHSHRADKKARLVIIKIPDSN